jgi:hypothetical protein
MPCVSEQIKEFGVAVSIGILGIWVSESSFLVYDDLILKGLQYF